MVSVRFESECELVCGAQHMCDSVCAYALIFNAECVREELERGRSGTHTKANTVEREVCVKSGA